MVLRGVVILAVHRYLAHRDLKTLLNLRHGAVCKNAQTVRIRPGNGEPLRRQPLRHGLVVRLQRQVIPLQFRTRHQFAPPKPLLKLLKLSHPQWHLNFH